MSSDTSVVTVTKVEQNTIELRVRTTTAGGLDDYSLTRSFALLLLADARRRGAEYGFERSETPRPLETEITKWEALDPNWYVSDAFMRDHVAEYIQSVEVVARRNVHGSTPGTDAAVTGALRRVELLGLPPREAEDLLCETMHVVDLRVTVTDPRWLAGLEPGLVFGSTAFDVWWDDPTRPEIQPGTPAPPPSSRWRVYSMDEKYWAIRQEGASHTVHYGKIGTKGQTKTKSFASEELAKKDVARLVREKTGKGYESEMEDFESDVEE